MLYVGCLSICQRLHFLLVGELPFVEVHFELFWMTKAHGGCDRNRFPLRYRRQEENEAAGEKEGSGASQHGLLTV